MPNLKKLVERFVYSPKSITKISEVRRLLEAFEYREKNKPGSECVFHKPGALPLTVPTIRGRKVKIQYVRLVVKRLELEEWLEHQRGE